MPQLTNLAKHIFNSPTLRADLEDCCREVHIKPMLITRNVVTRWNSLAKTLERSIALEPALNRLTVATRNFKRYSACFTLVSTFHLSGRSLATLRKHLLWPKCMFPRFCKYVCNISQYLCTDWCPEAPGASPSCYRWVDITQRILVPRRYR